MSLAQITRALDHVHKTNQATLTAERTRPYTAQAERLYSAQHAR